MLDVYTFHADPGHGWLEVPLADMIDVGLAPWDVSKYSYVDPRTHTFFLEEDCDASVFLRAYSQKYGHDPRYVVRHTDRDARCRSLPRNVDWEILATA